MRDTCISIRSSMIIMFILLMVTTVSIIGYIVFSSWLSTTNEIMGKMAEDMNVEIYNKVDAFIQVPLHNNELNHWMIENGIVDLDDKSERDRFFVGVLKSYTGEAVYSFSIGNENGEYYGARRNDNNDIEIMNNNSKTNGHSWYYIVTEEMTAGERVVVLGEFDASTRDWYKVAQEAGKPVFSPIYKHFFMDDLTVSAVHPIYNKEGRLRGVLGTHITLSKINNFLEEIVKDKNAFAMIIERNSGELIANSFGLENFKTLEDGTVKRTVIGESGKQSLVSAYEQYQNNKESSCTIKYETDVLCTNITEYRKDGLDWLVISAIPESLFMAGIVDNMKLTLLLTIVFLIISIVIYLILAYKFLKPIDSLIETTEKFSQGDLSIRETIARNDEIGKIAKSFNKMADTIYILVNNLEAKVKERTLELVETNNTLKDNKDQLENAKNHFQNLFDNSPVMKAIVKDNRCIQVNKAWADNTGYGIDEIVHADVSQVSILKDLSYCIDNSSQMTDDIREKQLQITYTTKSNEKRTALVEYRKFSESNSSQCLVIALDITKQQQYETELAKLERLHTTSQVAAAIAHEVRNPLTVVKGFTQIFSSKPEFNPYKDQLLLVVAEVDRANKIISDFLSLAKSDTYSVEYSSINDEINEILPLLNTHALKENVTIKTQLQKIPNTNISKNEFRQVILNIVNNAVDASSDGDTVTISTYKEDSYIIVSIADQGTGIPKEIQSNIGEIFYTTKDNGTGLGLSVCHTILRRHSGSMTFKTSNLGTTFYLHFPIVN